MEGTRKTKPLFSKLGAPIWNMVLQFLSPKHLLDVAQVSKTFKASCEVVIRQMFEKALKVKPSENYRETWEAVLRFWSKKPKAVFRLLHWAIGLLFSCNSFIEQNQILAVEHVMDRLFSLILTIELLKQVPNNLIQINIRHLLTRLEEIGRSKPKEQVLAELQSNTNLRHAIYSCLINCSLPEYRLMTPFYVCCLLGKEDVFHLLMKYEANVNTTDITNTLCVHAAIRSGNERIVAALLNMGANCTSPNKVGETPLMCACSKKLVASALLLIDRLNSTNALENQKALSIACQQGLTEVAHKMVIKGVSVNNKAYYKKTPLIYACESGEIKTIRMLLEVGADTELVAEGEKSLTALVVAVLQKNMEIVKELLVNGASPVGKHLSIESSAFAAALQEEKAEILGVLLQYHPLTEQDVSRLLSKFRNLSTGIKRLLWESTSPVEIQSLERTFEELEFDPVRNLPNKLKEINKEKFLVKKLRPFSARKMPHVVPGFPTCEGHKIGLSTGKQFVKREKGFRSPMSKKPVELYTAPTPKATSKPKDIAKVFMKKVPTQKPVIKVPPINDTTPVADLYFNYLSPEKGDTTAQYPEFSEHKEATPNKGIAVTPRSKGLTPMHKLLGLSPKTKQAKRLSKALADNQGKKRPKRSSRNVVSKQSSLPQKKKRSSKTKKRPLSCRTRITPAIQMTPRDANKPIESQKQRPKTVFSKYRGVTKSVSVEEEDLDGGGYLSGPKIDPIKEENESPEKDNSFRPSTAPTKIVKFRRYMEGTRNRKKAQNTMKNNSVNILKRDYTITKTQLFGRYRSGIGQPQPGKSEAKFVDLLAQQFKLKAPLVYANHANPSRRDHANPSATARSERDGAQLTNLLSAIRNSTSSLNTLNYAKRKFFSQRHNNAIKPIAPPLLIVTNSLKARCPFRIPHNHN